MKAEKQADGDASADAVYRVRVHSADQLIGAKMIVGTTLTTGELMSLLPTA